MSKKVNKSIEMTDVKISFISLVDKPANKRTFLITKGDDKLLECRILKADNDRHVITSVVYEPMKKDAHDNFMTADQIEKAAHWFLKNGNKVDFQHDFNQAEGCAIVESYIAPDDMEIGGEPVAKGTWVASIEVQNDDIWDKVQKGEITGFSMGGIGKYAEEETDLDDVEKSERKGLMSRLAKMLGIDTVEKGEFKDRYNYRVLGERYRAALETLSFVLRPWNATSNEEGFETDEAKITEALAEFIEAIRGVLASGNVKKCFEQLPEPSLITKSGRKISGKNAKKLSDIHALLEELLTDANLDEKEIEKAMNDVNNAITDAMIDARVEKKLAEMGITKSGDPEPAPAPAPAATPEPAPAPSQDESLDDKIAKAVAAAVPAAVEKAIKPFAEAAGLPTNLNDQHHQVQKSESDCPLHGFLGI